MNELSWLIYGAEVVGNLSVVLCVSGSFGFVAALVVFLGRGISSSNVRDYDEPSATRPAGTRDYQVWLRWKSLSELKWVYAFPVVCFIVAAFLPSTTAIYMIAASQAGEQIVTSPDAVEMLGDLKAIIKKRLKDELGSAAK